MKMPPFAPVLPCIGQDTIPQVPPIPADVTKAEPSALPTSSPKSTPSEYSLSDFEFISPAADDRDDLSSLGTTSSQSSINNSPRNDSNLIKRLPSQLNISYSHPEETTSVGFTEDSNVIHIPMKELTALAPETMATHLYCAYSGVLACQEAMWEELKDRVRNRPGELEALGWHDDEELEELQARKKFEALIQRYREYVIFFVPFIYAYSLDSQFAPFFSQRHAL
jgi:hypothetical protein